MSDKSFIVLDLKVSATVASLKCRGANAIAQDGEAEMDKDEYDWELGEVISDLLLALSDRHLVSEETAQRLWAAKFEIVKTLGNEQWADAQRQLDDLAALIRRADDIVCLADEEAEVSEAENSKLETILGGH